MKTHVTNNSITRRQWFADSIALVRDRLGFLSDGDRQWLLRKTAEQVYFFV